MSDLQKARREGMRWQLLNALNKARPIGAMDVLLLDVMGAIYQGVTANELHSQLDYLADHNMVDVKKQPDGHWHSKLTHEGVDVVEYTTDCPAGIARPAKYWEA